MNIKNEEHNMLSILVIMVFICSGVIITPSTPMIPIVEAASSWTKTNETEFINGTLDNIEIISNGTNASLKLLHDYDLFIGDANGVTYGYENTGNATNPIWTANSSWNVPDAGFNSAPAFADLDHDGDCDLLVGTNRGVSLGYQNTGTLSSPSWTANSSWDTLDIGQYTTPSFADLDHDNDYDLLIGAYNGLSYGYENTGNATSPTWTANSSWNAPDIGLHAVPAFADLDDDGDYDLLIGTQVGVSLGYQNTGSLTTPSWTANSSWDVPDVGIEAAVAIADLDNDGDYDLLIGTNSGISYGYENVGTPSFPTWNANSSWNVPDLGGRVQPAFADLDIGLDLGTYTSHSYDTGSNSTFKKIYWNGTFSTNTSIRFQLRTANNVSNLDNKGFLGPDGTKTTYYNLSSPILLSGYDGNRWVQYKIYFDTTDANIFTTLDDITLIYNYPPKTELVSPFDGNTTSNTKPTFKWKFIDLDSSQAAYQVLIDDDINFGTVDYNTGEVYSSSFNHTPSISINDGIWYWKVRTRDETGDWSAFTPPHLLLIDTLAPSSDINIPINDGFDNNLNTISGIATDTSVGSGVKNVVISIYRYSINDYWDGTNWVSTKTWLLTSGTSDWSYDSSSVTLTSGTQYRVQSKALDNLSHSETPSSGNVFTIDLDKPSSAIDFPLNNAQLNELNIFSGSALDTGGSNLDSVEFSLKRTNDDNYWDGNNWISDEYWLITTGKASWSYDCSNVQWLTDIQYKLCSRAKDNAGNVEHSDVEITFMFDDQPPNISMSINNDRNFTKSTVVTLALASTDAGSGVSQMAFSTDTILWSPWETFNHTKLITLPVGDGEKVVYFKVQDSVENVAIINDTIILDTESPYSISIQINDGQTYTNSRSIDLNFNAKDTLSGIHKMALSDDGIDWGDWIDVMPASRTERVEVFSLNHPYILSGGDGTKTVYFKVQDRAGNTAEPVSSSIILDTTPPREVSVDINEAAEYTNSRLVTLKLAAADTLSGIGEISFSINMINWTTWEPFNKTKAINLSSGDGEKIIYFKVKDYAGNIELANDTIVLDTTSPHSLLIMINNGALETNSTEVSLKLSAKDDISGVSQQSFSTDGVSWSVWESFTYERLLTLSANDGEKTVYFRVRDNAGNIAEQISATIILNATPPVKDSDGDDYPDTEDAFPYNSSEWLDTDGDMFGDNADNDDDDDGFLDEWETFLGTGSKNQTSKPTDTDGDKRPDGDENNTKYWMDTDDDDDGYSDEEEFLAGTNAKDRLDKPQEKEKDKETDDSMFGIGKIAGMDVFLLLLIIIIIIIILLAVLLRRKGSEDEEEEEPEEEDEETEEDEEEDKDTIKIEAWKFADEDEVDAAEVNEDLEEEFEDEETPEAESEEEELKEAENEVIPEDAQDSAEDLIEEVLAELEPGSALEEVEVGELEKPFEKEVKTKSKVKGKKELSKPGKPKTLKAKKVKGKKRKQAKPKLHTLDKSVKCNICLGYVKPGLNTITCGCGKHYHENCAKRLGECPSCGTSLEAPVDETGDN